ncbi:MAG: hypothetical protein IPL96_01210 [Holophagaceae bacterium]|nr:hypothetical protein [Holophagaceae bacterium]
MIPVEQAQAPGDYDARVRQPGLSAIDELVGRSPRLTRRGPRRKKVADVEEDIPPEAFPPIWRSVLQDMKDAYHSRCAYLALYIHDATGNPSVDHVLPKSYAWDQVYEWTNYRLCAGIINSKKGVLLTLVDPFTVGAEWFALNLNTYHVERGALAPMAEWARVDATLPVLNQRLCVMERDEYVRCYRHGPGARGFGLGHLEDRAPFIASELRRQGQLLRGDT